MRREEANIWIEKTMHVSHSQPKAGRHRQMKFWNLIMHKAVIFMEMNDSLHYLNLKWYKDRKTAIDRVKMQPKEKTTLPRRGFLLKAQCSGKCLFKARDKVCWFKRSYASQKTRSFLHFNEPKLVPNLAAKGTLCWMTFLCPPLKPVWSPKGPAHIWRQWVPVSHWHAPFQVGSRAGQTLTELCPLDAPVPKDSLYSDLKAQVTDSPHWPLVLTFSPPDDSVSQGCPLVKPGAQASLSQQSWLSENMLCSACWLHSWEHKVRVTATSTRILTPLFPILRSAMRTFKANAYNQETGLKVRILTEFQICGSKTWILLLTESRPHTFWKKNNSQKMRKTVHVYETSLKPMPHLRVWVFIRQRN